MNKVKRWLVKTIDPEGTKELAKENELRSRAEYSLFIEKRNTEHARKELQKVVRENSKLQSENKELSRKLSRLGIK